MLGAIEELPSHARDSSLTAQSSKVTVAGRGGTDHRGRFRIQGSILSGDGTFGLALDGPGARV